MWVIIARGGANYIFSVLYFRRGKSGTSTFPTLLQFTALFLTKSEKLITNIWQNSRGRDLWFADFFLKGFQFHIDFPVDFWLFCLKLLLILNFTNAVLSKTTFRSILS
jgi:hypothetical protein